MLDSLMLSSMRLESLEQSTAKYEANIDQAASYLTGRGIGREAALGHRLGYVTEPDPGHERFAGCLCIPYLLPGGTVALKFRRLSGDGPKYDGPSGQTPRLYNAGALAKGGDVVAICEGELDAIKVQQDLGIPAVGVPGASTWRPHWSRCFADFDRIIVFADHDDKEDGTDPGMKHAHKVARLLEADLIAPPAGMDVSEWLMYEGADVVAKAAGL